MRYYHAAKCIGICSDAAFPIGTYFFPTLLLTVTGIALNSENLPLFRSRQMSARLLQSL